MNAIWQKKIKIPVLSIILLSLIFGFAIAPLTMAQVSDTQSTAPATPPATTGTKTANPNIAAGKVEAGLGFFGTGMMWALNGFMSAFVVTMNRLTGFFGIMFNGAIEFSIDSNLRQFSAITAGWTISRDIANIFFVLFILVIAIATILGVQSYGAKSLLAKLIVVAILINFSLPLGLVIIDATNILGLQFYDKIKESAGSPSEAILAGTKLQTIFSANAPTDDSQTWKDKAKNVGQGVVTGIGAAIGIATCLSGFIASLGLSCGWGAFLAATVAGGTIGHSIGWAAITGTDFGSATEFFFLSFSTLVFLLPLLFVFVFGTSLILIRSIILILLLVLAPIAFVSYILPITERKLWHPWWETFLNHAFFLPAFMFLLYFSLSFINQINKDVGSGATPTDPKLMLLALTSALLLSASLILARKMGIYFADSVLANATLAKKWVTGAIGGVALRNTVGRLGGLMQKSPAIQGSIFGQRISQMMAKAGQRLPFGSYEELQKAKADIAMRQGQRRWAEEFLKLGTPGRLAMLSNMNDMQKRDLRERLKTLSPTGEQAFDNAMRLHFGEAALGKVDLENWKRMSTDEQKNLAPYSPEVVEQILRSFPDEDARAKWMLGLTPENKTKAMGIMSARFTTAELSKYNKAEKRQEMRNAELGAGGVDFASFVSSLGLDKDSDYLDAADDRQKLLWLEVISKLDPTTRNDKLKRYQNIIRTKLSPEDQERFHRETLRKASNDALENYISALPDAVLQSKAIAATSAAQQSYLFERWQGTQKQTIIDNAVQTLPADTQQQYREAVAKRIGQKTPDQIHDSYLSLPDDIGIAFMKSRTPDRNMEIIDNPRTSGAVLKQMMSHIKSAGLSAQYARRVNPLYKVQYIDGVDPAQPEFVEKVGDEIKNTSAKDLAAKLNANILANKQLKDALLSKGSLLQLANLAADTPAKQSAVKAMLTTDDAGNALSPGAVLNNIKAKNKELGAQIEALRKRERQTVMPMIRELLGDVFGEEFFSERKTT